MVHGAYALAAAVARFVEVRAEVSDEMRIVSYDLQITVNGINNIPDRLLPLMESIKSLQKFLGERRNLSISIKSELPASLGLGSSGSVAVATLNAGSSAFGHKLASKDLVRLAMISETMIHGNPSGIDVNVPVYGGIMLFQKGGAARSLSISSPIDFVVGMSGVQRETSTMINKVSSKRDEQPALFKGLTESSSRLGKLAAHSMEKGDLETLGAIMTMHHSTLAWLGVSSKEIDTLVEKTMSLGAMGAKVTGGGGGGSIIALPPVGEATKFTESLRKDGYEAFVARLPVQGASTWKEKN